MLCAPSQFLPLHTAPFPSFCLSVPWRLSFMLSLALLLCNSPTVPPKPDCQKVFLSREKVLSCPSLCPICIRHDSLFTLTLSKHSISPSRKSFIWVLSSNLPAWDPGEMASVTSRARISSFMWQPARKRFLLCLHNLLKSKHCLGSAQHCDSAQPSINHQHSYIRLSNGFRGSALLFPSDKISWKVSDQIEY